MHASLRVLAAQAAAVTWRVRRLITESDGTTRTEIQNEHPVSELIKNPNEHWTQRDLIGYTILHQVLCGRAHWHMEGDTLGEDTAIWMPHPRQMSPVLDAKRWISGWTFTVANSGEQRFFPVEDVLTVWELNPAKGRDASGLAPAKAMRSSLRIDQMLQRYQHQILRLGARFWMWLSTETTMDPDQRATVEEKIKLMFRGEENAGRVQVIEGDLKVNESAHSKRDADYPELAQRQVEIQSAMVGVPPVFQGRTQGVTYNQAEKQEVVFWMLLEALHLGPIGMAATKFFRRKGWLAADEELFGDTAPQRNAAPAVSQRALAQGRAQNVMTINEARSAFWNLHPIEGGDSIVTNTGLIILPDGTMTSVNALSVGAPSTEEAPEESESEAPVAKAPERMEDWAEFVRNMDPDRAAWVRAYQQRVQNPTRNLVEIHGTRFAMLAKKIYAEVAAGNYVVDRLTDWNATLDEWVGAVRPTWRATFEDSYKAALTAVGDRRMVMAGGNGRHAVRNRSSLDDSIERIIEAMAGFVDDTLASLKDDIRDVITEGLDAGTDSHEIARHLADIDGFEALIEGPGAELTRALKIATTEVTAISNNATLTGFKDSGSVVTKEWVTTSGNPRPSHASLNGSRVGVDDTFVNGAQYPGDPNLSGEERVGCLCLLGLGELKLGA